MKAAVPTPVRLPSGRWCIRFSAPPGRDGKRRQRRVYGDTQAQCKREYAKAMGQEQARRDSKDAKVKFGVWLDRRLTWWQSEHSIAANSLGTYRDAIELYLRPGLGHIPVGDLRRNDFRDLAAAMRLINRPEAASDTSDLLRRLLEVRAMRAGKQWSKRPISEGSIQRVIIVASSALADLVPDTLPVNPASSAWTGKTEKHKPLLWTDARVERWRQTGEIPGIRRLMVWTPVHCGAFLDSLEATENRKADRMLPLWHLAAYSGMRRSELLRLAWADIDLDGRRIHVRGTKSDSADRHIVLDAGTVAVLKNWRKAQLAERMRWGAEWTDCGLVFTKESGEPLRPMWVTQHFLLLVTRAGLPPVTFHALRHGAATMQLATGTDVKTVSSNLGHASAAMTMDVYAAALETLQEAAADRLAAFIPRRARDGG